MGKENSQARPTEDGAIRHKGPDDNPPATPRAKHGEPHAEKTCDTRHRLLAAAGELFARKSYNSVTIAEICRLAEANIAAVNYHFGGKENLYAQAWRHAFSQGLERHPPDGGVPADAPAAERFAGRLHAMVRRTADPESAEFNIMHNEMANPTGLLQDVSRDVLEPMRLQMRGLIRDLMGSDCDENTIRLCQMSIVAQVMHATMRRRLHRLHGVPEPAGELELKTIAEHIIAFSLAGMRYFSQGGERGDEPSCRE